MPDQVERFRTWCSDASPSMLPDERGEWVRYSDYEKLESKVAELRQSCVYWQRRLDITKRERDQARKQRDEELRERRQRYLRKLRERGAQALASRDKREYRRLMDKARTIEGAFASIFEEGSDA